VLASSTASVEEPEMEEAPGVEGVGERREFRGGRENCLIWLRGRERGFLEREIETCVALIVLRIGIFGRLSAFERALLRSQRRRSKEWGFTWLGVVYK
jgi:hypothetical protein